MKRLRFLLIIPAALLLAALAAACGGVSACIVAREERTASPIQSDDGSEYTAVPIVQPETEERTMTPTAPSEATEAKFPSEGEEVVQLAREDLGQRLDLRPEAIEVVSVEAVDWPDTSLGCPQPGMMYAQVITPGLQVVLRADDKTYEYHTETQQRVVYCQSEGGEPLLGGESTETVKLAKEDLARRLDISIDSIDVVAVIRQEFPPDAFHCRTTKERISRDESPAVIPGESILLSAAGREYEYHAGGQTVIFCRQLP